MRPLHAHVMHISQRQLTNLGQNPLVQGCFETGGVLDWSAVARLNPVQIPLPKRQVLDYGDFRRRPRSLKSGLPPPLQSI
jgi:hypothetical protein